MSSGLDGVVDPSFIYSAEARAQYGRLNAVALGDFDLASESTRLAAAIAVATDELTISSAELNGQAGTLDVSFLLTGTLDNSPGAGALAWTAVTAGSDPDAFGVGTIRSSMTTT